ncbi:MAG: aldo/keto reductase [Magnetococcales bacterium]|nr:aldo/keto reductase [Magnetococcales bacterium]
MNKENYLTSSYGVQIPPIIYGTAWKKDKTAGLVAKAIDSGFRGIDTACQPKHYNEVGVGQGVAGELNSGLKREELYLQTKFTPINGQDPTRIPYDAKADLGTQVAQSFQKSLENLQTPYLDCMVLHSPLNTPLELMTVWRAMETIFNDGGTKQLGISNCYDIRVLEYLYNKADNKPAVVQNRFYATTGYDVGIRDFCKKNNIIYQSFWTLTANPKVLASATIQQLAKKYGRTPEQIFFRYLTKSAIVPLTGTTSPQHMVEDLAIFTFDLAAEECKSIDDLLKG